MTTWADLTSQLTLLLDDTGETSSYPETLRQIAWNRACEYFATTHTANLKALSATASASGDGMIVGLPHDFLEVGGVKVDGRWLEPNLMIPGDAEDLTGWTLAEGGLYLPDPDVTALVLWYYGFYDAVTGNASPITVPKWAEWALINLCIAYLLTPAAIQMADLRRFQTKREAGTPEDNSSRVQAQYHLKQYHDVVGVIKRQQRELLFKPGR